MRYSIGSNEKRFRSWCARRKSDGPETKLFIDLVRGSREGVYDLANRECSANRYS